MTHALGSKHWVAVIAAVGVLAVSGCTAADPDDGGTVTSEPATASAAPSASPSSAESASAEASASPTTTEAPSASAAPTEAPTEPPSAEPTTYPEPPAAPAPAPTAAAPDAVGFCTAAELSGSVQDQFGGAAAGTVARTLVVTNSSAGACVVQGYPGVSFVDAAGTQLGAPAERQGAGATPVTLAPGASAVADLYQTNAQNYGADCGQTTAAGLRVYPPEATDSLFLPQTVPACTASSIALMTVGTFRAAG